MKILLSKSLAPTAQPSTKSKKLCFLFSNVSIKQGKMGTETTKIALNAHVHLRTANQQLSPPERHMDDITDMRRSCWLRENTSGQRPLGLSPRLLKVPNIAKFFVNRFCFVVIFCVQRIACRTKLCIFLEIYMSLRCGKCR